jgi:Protein of unknown function (DUF2897)
MLKAFIVIIVVAAVLIGGLLALRRSGRVGMPDPSVLERAEKRTREQDAADKAEDERSK